MNEAVFDSGHPLLLVVLTTFCFTLFFVISVLALRDAGHTLPGKLLAALCVSLAALQLKVFLPSPTLVPPGLNSIPSLAAHFFCIPNIGLMWWFCLSLLRDDFRLHRLAWLGMLFFCGPHALYFAQTLGVRWPFTRAGEVYGMLAPFAMVAHVVWVSISDRANDLLEARRRVRVWLVAGLMVATLVSLATEYLEPPLFAEALRSALSVMPAQLALFFWLVRLGASALSFSGSDSHLLPQTSQRAASALKELGAVDAKHVALHKRLQLAIDVEHIYRQPGLSIDDLAVKLNAPAHHLRQLINEQLGYRNFAALLNGYRLIETKAALSDLERARDTVSVIAFEAGLRRFSLLIESSKMLKA
jgi:AraC-like DNA-binding protein